MRLAARYRVPALAAVLSVVSLALVFGAVLGAVPRWLLPRVDALLPVIPHANAAISVVAVVVITDGWRAVRAGDVGRHRRRMLAGLALFAAFLVLYLYRISLVGPTHFDGPAVVGTYLYAPLLAVHVLLAIVCVPLLYYVALLAVTRPIGEVGETRHPRVGRVTAALWLVSFALGVAVYLLLYWVF